MSSQTGKDFLLINHLKAISYSVYNGDCTITRTVYIEISEYQFRVSYEIQNGNTKK